MHGLTGGSWKRSTLTTATKKNSRAGNRSAHSGFATYSQDLPPRQLSPLRSSSAHTALRLSLYRSGAAVSGEVLLIRHLAEAVREHRIR